MFVDETPGGMTELAKIMIRDCKYDVSWLDYDRDCKYDVSWLDYDRDCKYELSWLDYDPWL